MNIDKLLDGKGGVEGEIWVTDFSDDAAIEFREEILEASKKDPLRPIVVYIHSYGGAVDCLASMIETMDEVPNPIITVAHGMAMSCGAVLLSHGDIRFVGKNSRIMVHEVSGGVGVDDVHNMFSDAAEVKRLNRWFMGLLAKNCEIKGGYEAIRKLIKDQDGRNRWMGAEEAVKFGIADAVGVPKVSRMKLYQVEVTPPKEKITKDPPKKNTKGKKSETRHK
jgi:ATP-dependent Clp protease protease subunit